MIRGWVVIKKEVSEYKKAYDNPIPMENLAFYFSHYNCKIKGQGKELELFKIRDPVTGLWDRNLFLHILDYKIWEIKANKDSRERFALLILALNEFVEIKEALGQATGDRIIEEFGLKLKEKVGDQDIVARFAEDEFAILIPHIDNTRELKKMVDEILVDLNSSFIIDDEEFQITTSIGVAIYPDDGIDSTSLIKKAYIIMYKVEKFSVNRHTAYGSPNKGQIKEYFCMKNDLKRAISNEELLLNYQPIYDTRIDKVIGVEALVRWKHRERGIIPPSKFIPLAERTGLIHTIGDWVLFNACKENKEWQKQGYQPVYVSVNISLLQLEQPGFTKIVGKILERSQLDPKYLQLEIKETSFTQKYDLIKNTIEELNQLGVRLAIDDFGTGYSSPIQLFECNIDNIKIHKVLIDGIEEDEGKGKILKAIISLADGLNIGLVATGVESQGQLEFLKENGCSLIQGYLFSKPVESDEIERMLIKYEEY